MNYETTQLPYKMLKCIRTEIHNFPIRSSGIREKKINVISYIKLRFNYEP